VGFKTFLIAVPSATGGSSVSLPFGYMPSTEPRKEFFGFYEVDYEAETVTRTHNIGIHSNGGTENPIEIKPHENLCPIQGQQG
jgi:hypothetical protein